MIDSLSDLSPAARQAAEDFLVEATKGLAADERDLAASELLADLLAGLTNTASPADVHQLAALLNPTPDDARPPQSWFAKLPFGLRIPTAGRIAAQLWDPTDERLFRPRFFGFGWDLNLGAAAVRLGLIEPDAEDVPFDSTPTSSYQAAAVFPLVAAGATAAHYAFRGRALPAKLPARWGLTGSPTRWTTKRRAIAQDLLITLTGAALACWATRPNHPGSSRAGAAAAGTSLAAAGATTAIQRSLSPKPRWWLSPGVAVAVIATSGATLLGLARAGRASEMRRDLEK